MFRTLLAKEFLEQRRTSKLWIFLAVFFIVGCISPLLARYTPDLLRSIPNIPPEFARSHPRTQPEGFYRPICQKHQPVWRAAGDRTHHECDCPGKRTRHRRHVVQQASEAQRLCFE